MDRALPSHRAHASKAALSLLMSVVIALAGLWAAAGPAAAGPALTVTSTTTAKVASNTTSALAGLSINGADPATEFQLTVATTVGTLSFPQTSGLTLAYGNDWSGTGSVTFSGLPDDLNTALAAVRLTVGADQGRTAVISITGLVDEPGYVYSPTNAHFYQYVAEEGLSWSDARNSAKQRTFLGQTGYLATIPTDDINTLIAERIENAVNVWFGGRSIDTYNAPIKRTWEWADGPLAGDAFTYCSEIQDACDGEPENATLYHSWAPGEPNNCCISYDWDTFEPIEYSGEPYPVTNWGGSIGKWNDLPDDAGLAISGFVVEYGDLAFGATSLPGVASASSNVAIVAAPGAPTAVTAERGNGSATITFIAPDDNGSPITGYVVTTYPGGIATSCAGSPCTVGDLDNGSEYYFTVSAVNDNGTGPESEPSNSVVPATVPGNPTGVSAVGGDKSATVSFAAPDDDGGSVITSYTVTSSPGDVSVTCPGSPCVVTGLHNGSAYTFTVVATNEVGDSAPSGASPSTEVRTVPDAPTGVSATGGDGSATITFTPPEDDGGAEISGYLVTAAPGGRTASCSASPCLISGLTNGKEYTFTVQAVNVVGPSDPSDASSGVTPRTVPGAPVDLTVNRGDRSAELTFLAPEDDGGAAILRYEVSTDGGESWTTLETSGSAPITAKVTGLANGNAYDIAVRAVNAAGPGPSTASSNITPAAAPDAPSTVVATRGDGQASVAFTAPADNGSPISGYIVVVAPGGRQVLCDASPCVVRGLDNGQQYTFTVIATNDVGDSDPSEPSEAVTPAAKPGRPVLGPVYSVDSGIVLSFTPPESDGGIPVLGYQVSVDGGDTWQTLITDGEGPITATVYPLVNGTAYDVAVRAVNEVGPGGASGMKTATPATVPTAPRDVAVSVVGGAATVSWTAPASTGGSPVVGYRVTAEPGGSVCLSLTPTCTFADLPPGLSYTFSVVADNTATNRNGTGYSAAAVSSEVPVTDVPEAPAALSVTPGDRILTLAVSPPANDGGVPVTSYQVSIDDQATWKTLKLSVAAAGAGPSLAGSVPGVHNGETFQVAVRARNANGTGPATASVTTTTVQWFSDLVRPADRAAEIKVPKHPEKYKGPAAFTKARARSANGTVSYPAGLLDGRQLQKGQAVEIKGSYFAPYKTTLSKTGLKEVKAMAASLTYVDAVTCEGYADYGGIKSHAIKFAKGRAKTVCDAIKKYAKQVSSRKIAGYSNTRPQVVGKSSERAINRRVVVLIRST